MAKANLDKLQAVKVGNLENVVATVDLPNGSTISLGEAIDGQFELVNAVAPVANQEVLLVVAPEVVYNNKTVADELDYTTKAGKEVRAFHLTVGDKFQVERALFEAEPVKGDIVTGSATYGWKVAAGTEQTKCVVEQLTVFGAFATPMALLRVLSV